MVDGLVADEVLWATIDFAQPGNSAEFRGHGWSGQEGEHVWAIGATSELLFKSIPERGALLAKLDVWPHIALPALTAQRLTVLANGAEVGNFEVTKHELLEFLIPDTAILGQDRLLLEFRHPDAARPSDVNPNHPDRRRLALAFHHLELRRVTITADVQAEPVSDATPIALAEPAEAHRSAEPIMMNEAPVPAEAKKLPPPWFNRLLTKIRGI